MKMYSMRLSHSSEIKNEALMLCGGGKIDVEPALNCYYVRYRVNEQVPRKFQTKNNSIDLASDAQ